MPRSRRRPDPLVTNEGVALAFLARHPRAELSDIARGVGVDQRTVQRLLDRLEAAEYLTRRRVGRGNEYTVHLDAPLVRPEASGSVGVYLGAVSASFAWRDPIS